MSHPTHQNQAPSPQTQTPAPNPMMDGAAWFFVALAIVTAGLLLWLKGSDALMRALTHAADLLLMVAPMILVGVFLGGLVKEISDPKKVAPILGAQSGWKGLILATALGAATPGGPFAAFPIVYALSLAGADVGAVITFLTAWSVLGLHRLVIWEFPLLGTDFVLTRFLASLPLPLIAGLFARELVRYLPNIPIGRDGPPARGGR